MQGSAALSIVVHDICTCWKHETRTRSRSARSETERANERTPDPTVGWLRVVHLIICPPPPWLSLRDCCDSRFGCVQMDRNLDFLASNTSRNSGTMLKTTIWGNRHSLVFGSVNSSLSTTTTVDRHNDRIDSRNRSPVLYLLLSSTNGNLRIISARNIRS